MKETDISNTLGKILRAADLGYHIVWGNRDQPSGSSGIYLVFQMTRLPPRAIGLKGQRPQHSGFATITVVGEQNKFETETTQLGDIVASLYPSGQRIDVPSGGSIEISSPPHVMSGFPDEKNWRVPVKVGYRVM